MDEITTPESMPASGINILLAISGLDDEGRKTIIASLSSYGIQIASTASRYRKMGVDEHLWSHPETDVLLVSENLETAAPYSSQELARIAENHEHLMVIPVLNKSHQSDAFLLELYHADILCAVFQDDASMETISRIIQNPRTRKAAKKYYGLRDEPMKQTLDLRSCVEHISQGSNPDECASHARYVLNQLGPPAFQEVLEALPDDIRNSFVKSGLFLEYLQAIPPFPHKGGILSGILHKFLRRGKPYEPSQSQPGSNGEPSPPQLSINLAKIVTNVMVGVCAITPGSGATTQSIAIARFLQDCGFRVALLERCTAQHKSFASLSKYLGAQLSDGSFHSDGIDFYFDIDSDHLLEIRKGDYNFLVSDFGVCGIDPAYSECRHKIMVVPYSPWSLIEFDSYLERCPASDKEAVFHVFRGIPASDRSSFMDEWPGIRGGFHEGASDSFLESVSDFYMPLFADYLPIETQKKEERKAVRKLPSKKSGERSAPMPARSGTTFFITSLRSGAGATHVGIAITHVLSSSCEGPICYYSRTMPAIFMDQGKVDASGPPASPDLVCCRYHQVIFDCGIVSQLTESELRELKRSHYKVMLCLADDDYLESLKAFVEKLGDSAADWFYMFNMADEERYAAARKALKGLATYRLPKFSALDPEGRVRSEIEKMLLRT